jgi:hypothetical protein
MFGFFLDVTGQKQAEESNNLLAGEISHLAKNLLAIASGLTLITQRSSASAEDIARQWTCTFIFTRCIVTTRSAYVRD